jgi:DNA-binding MarR family transcriptional regulator
MFERCLYFNVNALARAVNRIWNEAFEPLGLSPAHAYLLRLVLVNPGLSQKEIGEQLRLEKSTVTRFVDALQERQLVQRRRGALGDAREQGIHPTKAAERLKQALGDQGDALYREMLDRIGKEELTVLVAQLRKVEELLR